MVGKNNEEMKRKKSSEKVNKYSIRKFKNGIASAAIGALLVGAGLSVDVASAEEADTDQSVEDVEAATEDTYTETNDATDDDVQDETPTEPAPAGDAEGEGDTPEAPAPAGDVEGEDDTPVEPEVVDETPEAPAPEVAPLVEDVDTIAEARAALEAAQDYLAELEWFAGVHGNVDPWELAEAETAVENAQAVLDDLLAEQAIVDEVIDAIDGLAYDEWVATFPDQVAEVRAMYDDALDSDLQTRVTNYDDLVVAETRVDVNSTLADHLLLAFEENADGRYTDDSYAIFLEAFNALAAERDNPAATVESLRESEDVLLNAVDNLEIVPTLDERIAEAQAALEAAESELTRLQWLDSTHGNVDPYELLYAEAAVEEAQAALDALLEEEASLAAVAEVIAAIEDLADYDGWYVTFPNDVAEVRDIYDALGENYQPLVTNFDDLVVAETRADVNGLLAEFFEIAYVGNADGVYTPSTWADFEAAYEALAAERDNPDATVDSLREAEADLQEAADNLRTVEDVWNALLDRIAELEDRLEELSDANVSLENELEVLRAELADLRADQEAADERIAELEDRIAELEGRVEDLEEDVDEAPTPTDPTDPEDPVDPVDPEDPTDTTDPVDEDTDVDNGDTDVDDDGEAPTPVDPTEDDVVVEADDTVVLPQTGMAAGGVGLGVASLLSGLGLAVIGKKRKEDE